MFSRGWGLEMVFKCLTIGNLLMHMYVCVHLLFSFAFCLDLAFCSLFPLLALSSVTRYEEVEIKSGWLFKKAESSWGWRKRWFVLYKSRLAYFSRFQPFTLPSFSLPPSPPPSLPIPHLLPSSFLSSIHDLAVTRLPSLM